VRLVEVKMESFVSHKATEEAISTSEINKKVTGLGSVGQQGAKKLRRCEIPRDVSDVRLRDHLYVGLFEPIHRLDEHESAIGAAMESR
jgi:hypothetical protein